MSTEPNETPPLAPCCDQPWTGHLGVVGLCRELENIKSRVVSYIVKERTEFERLLSESRSQLAAKESTIAVLRSDLDEITRLLYDLAVLDYADSETFEAARDDARMWLEGK